MNKRKSPQLPKRDRPSADRRSCVKGDGPKLSREWTREIERRARDSLDPLRYMPVSEFRRSFILYYDISDDVFAMNAPEKGTLFKRRQPAELFEAFGAVVASSSKAT